MASNTSGVSPPEIPLIFLHVFLQSTCNWRISEPALQIPNKLIKYLPELDSVIMIVSHCFAGFVAWWGMSNFGTSQTSFGL